MPEDKMAEVLIALQRIEARVDALTKVVKDVKENQDDAVDFAATLQSSGIERKLDEILEALRTD